MRKSSILITFLLAAAVLFASIGAQADTYRSHADRWEFTFQMRYLDEQTVKFTGGSQIKTNSDIGWGFGVGYNFNDHLSMGFDFGWSSPSYDATIASADNPPSAPIYASGTMSTSNLNIHVNYNFIAGPVTPFITAGLGTTYVDTNLAYGPPQNTCWWDPFWGYVCGTYQPTYSVSRVSYNTGVGLRWEIKRDAFMRVSIGKQWIDLPDSSNNDFTFGRLELGINY